MKKFLLLLSVCFLVGSLNSFAQLTSEQIKERQELKKATKAELNEKATKTARKEAKKLTKEGWKVSPGALPMEKQLDRSYMMEMEFDEDMFQKFIIGDAQSFGSVYDAAKMQATELAKQALAGKIQTEVTALIENTVANEQVGKDVANSLAKSIMANKNLILVVYYLSWSSTVRSPMAMRCLSVLPIIVRWQRLQPKRQQARNCLSKVRKYRRNLTTS